MSPKDPKNLADMKVGELLLAEMFHPDAIKRWDIIHGFMEDDNTVIVFKLADNWKYLGKVTAIYDRRKEG